VSKEPELLESVQWTGDNLEDMDRFVNAPCTVDAGVLRMPVASAGQPATGLVVPLHGWIVRVDGDLRVLAPRTPVPTHERIGKAQSPDVERFADHLAMEGGFD
jgi:hypothetical protein